jgi:predicted flavoprotein YhiN
VFGADMQVSLTNDGPVTFLLDTAYTNLTFNCGGVNTYDCLGILNGTALPGTFCAGEMLDWEAPTGGYLLSACFASGLRAGRGAVAWLQQRGRD